MRGCPLSLPACAATLLLHGLAPAQAASFTNFETGQVHPLRISADGTRLFGVHTPDNRLLVWSLLDPRAPVLLQEIPVGLEPVSVMPRTPDEVWVVNRLSDTVSVVSLSRGIVTHTLQVKDEPADVVFAGSPLRAFVSVAGSKEVRVFDVTTHALVATVPIFGEQPTALAVSPDGQTVWVAVQRSGNKTTIVPEPMAPPQPLPWGPGLPYPPQTGLIVRSDDPRWQVLGVNLPDHDVVGIDAGSAQVRTAIPGVGTTLFGVAPRPTDGSLWVANTEANNEIRFEPVLRAGTVQNRVTRIVPGPPDQLAFFPLSLPRREDQPLPDPVARAEALAQPTDLQWDPAGQRLFVAAFGSDRIGVLDPSGRILARIDVAPGVTSSRHKRGPRGVAHHPTAPVLYVLNRLRSSLAVVDTQALQLLREEPFLFDPTPTAVREGRGFLYDALLSGNGSMACATCHVDGDQDGLAWDLGDPGGSMQQVGFMTLHPMKGPLTTQTLRGLTGAAPYHWRGDRQDLAAFNPAFDALMGGTPLGVQDLADFVTFQESIQYPPNPDQNLDRSYSRTPAGLSAHDGMVFFTTQFFSTARCVDCHALPVTTNGGLFSGSAVGASQPFKVSQLRNLYQRQGRVPVNGQRTSGFGIMHDGSVDRVFDFLNRSPFPSLQPQPNNRLMLERFLLSVDTGTAPAVGATRTVTAANASDPTLLADLATLVSVAGAGHCDLVVKGLLAGQPRGLVYDGASQTFRTDRFGDPPWTLTRLVQEAAQNGAILSVLGVPPGSGTRIGIDHDLDGNFDLDALPAPYGSSSPGCNGPLGLAANSPPRAGNLQFALSCSAMQPSANGMLLLGTQPADLPALGIRLLVQPARLWVLPMPADSRGTGVFRLPLPRDPGLFGATLHVQALSASTCGSAGLAASQGLRVVVQG